VRTQTGTLLLISWRVNIDGSITRAGDSAKQAGRASNIDIARRGNKYVTACRTASGNLKLISWDVTDAGAITRTGDSGDQAGEASRIKIVALTDTIFVTACCAGSAIIGRRSPIPLMLISWRLNSDGSFTRLKDSGTAAGAVSEVSLIVFQTSVPRIAGRVITSVRTDDGRLKLIVWSVANSGSFTRLGDSASRAGAATMIRSVLYVPGSVVTAVCAGNDKLKLISWGISNNGETVTRLHDSGEKAGKIRDNALSTPRALNLISAVQTEAGNLKLISWFVDGEGVFERLGDSRDQAGAASLIVLNQEEFFGPPGIVTSVRTASKTLKLISWQEVLPSL
jgi:hypothetical protein